MSVWRIKDTNKNILSCTILKCKIWKINIFSPFSGYTIWTWKITLWKIIFWYFRTIVCIGEFSCECMNQIILNPRYISSSFQLVWYFLLEILELSVGITFEITTAMLFRALKVDIFLLYAFLWRTRNSHTQSTKLFVKVMSLVSFRKSPSEQRVYERVREKEWFGFMCVCVCVQVHVHVQFLRIHILLFPLAFLGAISPTEWRKA